MTIAITGATGQFGRLAIAALKRRGATDIIALARDPAKAADLGVPVRAFDYSRPETLASALSGVDRLLLVSGTDFGHRAEQHANVVNAAKAAGVAFIAYTSIVNADTSAIDLAAEHRETEAIIAASGIPHTFLRNGWYNENYAGAIGGALASGVVAGSAGDGRIASAARADYAEAAAVVIAGGEHDGAILELGGDSAWTLSDLASEIGAKSGKEVRFLNLPTADYAAALAAHGLPEGFAKVIAGWEPAIEDGALFDDSKTLSSLIGRPTTPISAYVGAMVAG